jgi:hypothetical protein
LIHVIWYQARAVFERYKIVSAALHDGACRLDTFAAGTES